MISVIIKRKNLYKVVNIENWTAKDLNNFLKAYMNRDDYSFEFRRVIE